MPEITDEELATLQAQAARGAQADELAAEVERLTPLANELEAARNETTQATAAARAAIIAANPTIPADLIQGDSIGQIEQSLANAQAIANRLAEAQGRPPLGFPTGGTVRQPATVPEGVSGSERIRWGLANRSAQ
jgi:hypothetical protein